jgi:phage gpG-like protein
MAKKRLGIIQSRGLGDIVIALPIARHYYEEGWEILWPIVDTFIPNFEHHAPWVKWIPLQFDAPGRYFYDVPLERLKNFKCDEILPLYQHLSGHDFSQEKYFQYTSFDQYKYIRAGVPFLDKWRLADSITRDLEAEQHLYDQLVSNPNYAVVHLEGSDHTAQFDPGMIPPDWSTIYIREGLTPSIFNWIKIIEGAQSIIMVDSCMANLTDQLGLGSDHYFIQRSHVGLTPVHNLPWTWL